MAVRDLVDRVEWVIPLVLELVTARVAAPEPATDPVVALELATDPVVALELGIVPVVALGLGIVPVVALELATDPVVALELGIVPVVAELVRARAVKLATAQPHGHLGVLAKTKSVTTAHHPDQVPLLEVGEDLAVAGAETTLALAAAEAVKVWAAAE
jgi:hypothetical protein